MLYATTDGLHLRIASNDFEGFKERKGSVDENGDGGVTGNPSGKGQWTVEPEFVTEFCDLTVPIGANGVIADGGGDRHRQHPPHLERQMSFGDTHQLVDPKLTHGSDEGFHDDKTPLIGSLSRPRKRQSDNRRKIKFNPAIEEIPNTPMGSDEKFDSGIVPEGGLMPPSSRSRSRRDSDSRSPSPRRGDKEKKGKKKKKNKDRDRSWDRRKDGGGRR